MMRSHLVLCLCVSVKGEILCSQKDFRINLFVPGEGDMILLTFRSVASTSLPHSDFAQLETQPPGTPHLTCSVLHDTFPPALLPFFFLLDFHYFGFWFFFYFWPSWLRCCGSSGCWNGQSWCWGGWRRCSRRFPPLRVGQHGAGGGACGQIAGGGDFTC